MELEFAIFLEHSLRSIGIMTAHNPVGGMYARSKQQRDVENGRRNASLASEIIALGYSPISVRGKYAGKRESSYVIPDIRRKEIVELGRLFQQEAVIWGQRTRDGFDFEWIEGNRTVSVHRVPQNQVERILRGNLTIPF